MFQSSQIAGEGRLRDGEAELRPFAVDAWRSPARVVRFHAADESLDLVTDLRSTEGPGAPAPTQSESGAVPGDDRLRSGDNQALAQPVHHCRSTTQNSRSRLRRKERGRFRLNTTSCWRRATISKPEPVSGNDVRADICDYSEDEPDHDLSSYAIPTRAGVRNIFTHIDFDDLQVNWS